MSAKSSPWSFTYPNIIDKDGEAVAVTGNMGAANFVLVTPRGLNVKDASNIPMGSYQCSLTLFDGKDKVTYFFTLKVVPPIAGAEKEEKKEEKKIVAAIKGPEFDAEAARLAAEKAAELERLKALRASWSPYPPNPFVKSITEKGLITVGFTSDIVVKPDLTMINNGTLYLSDLEFLPPPLPPLRSLQHRELPLKNEKKVPVLTVEVLPGSDESNSTALSFVWNVTQETPKDMTIQLYFDEPLVVSSNPVSLSLLIFKDSR
jgi:hypothetical protein